ncbi:DUF4190 domain-containing protein [Streptomyces klenkii]|uniref:DUF4190 domain-containing protein n=1 Tax=Streptomyces klenkii TaxID=1420899 RepID=UPI00342D30B1
MSDATTGGTTAGSVRDEVRSGRNSKGDEYAVASFITGLAGLLVFNLFLGPCAIAFGSLALLRATTRRGRALFGIALGVADLVVLTVLVTINGTISWSGR